MRASKYIALQTSPEFKGIIDSTRCRNNGSCCAFPMASTSSARTGNEYKLRGTACCGARQAHGCAVGGLGPGFMRAKGSAATGRYWSGPLVHSFPTQAEPFDGRRTRPIEACVAQANPSTSSGRADKKFQTSRGRINRLLHRPRLLVDRYGQPVLKKALRPGPYPRAYGRGQSQHHHRPPCVRGQTALRWIPQDQTMAPRGR